MEIRAQLRSQGVGGAAALTGALLALLAGISVSPAWAASARFTAGLVQPAVGPDAPEVKKVLPDTGPVSGGTEVVLTGRNFTGATEVEFGSTPVSFSVHKGVQITATAPPGVEGAVNVTVTTPEGVSAITTSDRFFYVPPGPVVLELAPSEGPAIGGQEVKIFGAHLEGATEVSFGGASVPFEVLTPETIRASAPEGVVPSVEVRVTTPEGTSPTSPGDVYEYRSKPPQISALSPKSGPAAGGNAVVISGDEFFGVTEVKFGELSATSFSVSSPKSITAVAPPQTVQKLVVSVETTFGPSELEFCKKRNGSDEGASCSIHDYYKYLEPTITNVTPSSGPVAGGTSITLTGTGFALGETETQFTIDKMPVTDVDCTAITTCTAVTPPAKKHGVDSVIVSVKGNEPEHSKASPAAEFTYE
jgi:hypothetical protein